MDLKYSRRAARTHLWARTYANRNFEFMELVVIHILCQSNFNRAFRWPTFGAIFGFEKMFQSACAMKILFSPDLVLFVLRDYHDVRQFGKAFPAEYRVARFSNFVTRFSKFVTRSSGICGEKSIYLVTLPEDRMSPRKAAGFALSRGYHIFLNVVFELVWKWTENEGWTNQFSWTEKYGRICCVKST